MFSQIAHIEWPYLVKLAILIWLINLFAMPTKLPTYLPITYLLLYLNMSYLPTYQFTYLPSTYLLTYHLPTYVLPTYLPFAYLPTTYLCPTYLPTYLRTIYLLMSYLPNTIHLLFTKVTYWSSSVVIHIDKKIHGSSRIHVKSILVSYCYTKWWGDLMVKTLVWNQ
jgi:hypothetical protein